MCAARVVIFVAYRLVKLRDFRTSSKPSFTRIEIIAWTQAELAFSLITATLPCLLAFMGKLNSAWGTINPQTVIVQSQAHSQKITGGSYELGSLGRGGDLRSHKSVGACNTCGRAHSAHKRASTDEVCRCSRVNHLISGRSAHLKREEGAWQAMIALG